MTAPETYEIERKILAILKILSDSKEPLGGRTISRHLKENGISLCERAVRYHLQIMDERGFTRNVGGQDGRAITEPGLKELESALACDRLGFLPAKIELLAYLTTFDLYKYTGNIPVDVSLIAKVDFPNALKIMKSVFKSGLCISDLVSISQDGEKLGDVTIPKGRIGLATISSISIIGSLLKCSIPVDSRFGGLVQIQNFKPLRFINFTEYKGTTIDPLEVFTSSKMTSVSCAATKGEGVALASFHEIPMLAWSAAESILKKLNSSNLAGIFTMGKTTERLCEVSVNLNKIGMILFSGLNPAASAHEQGIDVLIKSMAGTIDIKKMISFGKLQS